MDSSNHKLSFFTNHTYQIKQLHFTIQQNYVGAIFCTEIEHVYPPGIWFLILESTEGPQQLKMVFLLLTLLCHLCC